MIVSLMAGALLLGPPRLDDAALAIVNASRDMLAKASSVSGTAVQEASGRKTTYKFRLMRPNYMDIVSSSVEYHSDGETLYFYMVGNKQYQKMAARKEGQVMMLNGFQPIVGAKMPEIKEAESATFDGKAAVKAKLPGNPQVAQYLYIDKKTKMPLGWSQTYSGQTMEFKYSGVKLGEKMETSTFAWTPPADAEVYKQPDFMASLLKEGADAPDFSNDTTGGTKVSLKETLGKSKALLLNFWFYG
jgi:outer membrane lipoprotein-sorting protein